MASLDTDFTVHVTVTPPNLITMQGKYQTRDGRAVRILANDAPHNYPVVGCIQGISWVTTWHIDGTFDPENRPSPNDLIPIPTKHENWRVLNGITHAMTLVVYGSREQAQYAARELRDATGITPIVAHVIEED